MALSGTLYSGTFGPGSHYKLRMVWSATQSTSANTSTVKVQMGLWGDSSWTMYTSTTHDGNISIDPSGSAGLTNHGISDSISMSGGTWVDLGSQISQTITHNDDGTMSFWLDGDFDFTGIKINDTSLGDVNFTSTEYTLDTIPRASTVSSFPTFTAGTQNATITLTTHSSSFHHTISMYVTQTGGTASAGPYDLVGTRTSVGSSYTWVFTDAEIKQLYTTNSGYENRPMKLHVTTYDSSNNTVGTSDYTSGQMNAVATGTTTLGTGGSFNIAGSISYSINNFVTALSGTGTFYYDITLAGGSGSTAFTYTWSNVTTKSSTLTLPPANVTSLYNATPNSNTLAMTVTTRTKYDTIYTEDGAPTSHNTTATAVVTGSNPSFGTGYTYADTNSTVTAITNSPTTIIQNLSTLTVTLPYTANATATNGATMKNYVCTVNGVSVQVNYNASANITFNMGMVNASTTQTLYMKAVDSRGNSLTTSISLPIVPYAAPIVNAGAKRDDGFDPNTTVTLTGTYSPIIIGPNNVNPLKTVQYAYGTVASNTYGSPVAFSYATTNSTYTATGQEINAPNGLDSASSWNVQVTVADQFSPTVKTVVVAAGTPILFIDSALNSVGVNQFPAHTGSFEVTGSVYATGDLHGNGVYGNTGADLTLSPASGKKIVIASPMSFPSNQYASSTGGAVIQLNNSDITGFNQMFNNDTATTDSEAIQWAKDLPNGQYYFDPVTGAPNYTYFDAFRVYNSQAMLNGIIMGTDYNQATLWSGSYYLVDTQTITPTKKLSQCTNGWIMGWSDYTSSTANNYDWNYIVIPKWHVINTAPSGFAGNGIGMYATVATTWGVWTTKYFYVSDDHITGHVNNSNATTNPNSTAAVVRVIMAF